MSQKAKLIKAEPKMYNGSRDKWDRQGKILYAWLLTVEINGSQKVGKAFSNSENSYPIPSGSMITFETDWVEKYGYPYFKSVKKADAGYGARQTKNFKAEILKLVIPFVVNIAPENADKVKDFNYTAISQYLTNIENEFKDFDKNKVMTAIDVTKHALMFNNELIPELSINNIKELKAAIKNYYNLLFNQTETR